MYVIQFIEKHGERVFTYETDSQLDRICRKVINERRTLGWYEGMDEEESEMSYETPYLFLQVRGYAEYEGFKVLHPETY